jgi:hypothetical protein
MSTQRAPHTIGLCLAGALLFRLQNSLWLLWILPALYHREGRGAPGVRAGLVVAGVASLGIAPQTYLQLAHPGGRAIRWDRAFFNLDDYGNDLVRVVVGEHGLLSFTPVAVLALIGIAVALGRSDTRAPALGVFAVLTAQCLLGAAVLDPDAGDAFGARRLSGLGATFALGYGCLLSRAPLRHNTRVLAVVFGLGVVVNLARTHAAVTGTLSLRSTTEP